MNGIVATRFGEPDDVLEMRDDLPKPELKKGEMVVKVLAMSLSPGDWRMISGETKIIKKPKKWPYIPGLDVCGIVEEIAEGEKFKKGDIVVCTWTVFGTGGMAEYASCSINLACLKPATLTPVEAAGMANTYGYALNAWKIAKVKAGERVLIIGGSGGMGSTLVQFTKNAGAFVASTSTQTEMLKDLGVDRPINYTEENWWELEEFKNNPFDVIIDCAEGRTAFHKCRESKVLKRKSKGGRFVAVVPNEWFINGTSIFGLLSFFASMMKRIIFSKITPSSPRYSVLLESPTGKTNEEMFKMVEDGKLHAILDPRSPFPFSAQGAKDAFNLLKSRHAHGKIVIEIAQL